jgi:hypothetical protein
MATLMREPSARRRRMVLETAYELGIRHFDVAPLYGLGRAEPDLGEFIRSAGVLDVTVATKFGLAPSRRAQVIAPLQAPIRSAMARSNAVRRLGKAAERSAGAVASLSPGRLDVSVAHSLDKLGLPRVDVLILHEVRWSADWSEVWPSIQESPGYAGLGISGFQDVFSDYPNDAIREVALVQSPPGVQVVGEHQRVFHSVLGAFSSAMTAAIIGLEFPDRERLRQLVGRRELDATAVRLLSVLGLLSTVPESIVLVGTTNPSHLTSLLSGVADAGDRMQSEDLAVLRNTVAGATEHSG